MLKNDFVYAIPSYNRAKKQITVEYLSRIGVGRRQIYVFVQTKEDEQEYKKTVGDKANVVFMPASRGVEARNNILNALCADNNVLMLDDDVKSIGRLVGKRLVKVEDAELMGGMFDGCFKRCAKEKAKFFGVYPVYNAYFMSQTISTKAPINTIFGFVQGFKGRYDESYDTKEDAALCAKVLSMGGRILRFNYLAVDADHRKTKNGYIDKWHQEENVRCVKKLIVEFPDIYKPQKNKPWEVRTTIKDYKLSKEEGIE